VKNILLFYGGISAEHEVSCVSASYIETSLINAEYLVYPIYVDKKGTWHLQEKVNKIPSKNIINHAYIKAGKEKVLICGEKEISIDFAFSIIHGTFGEDGCIQGFFEFLNIPYAGAGVLTSSICMDKFYMRQVFAMHGIPQPEFVKLDKIDFEKDNEKQIEIILNKLNFPIFTKPCNMGSSVGVYKSKSKNDLKEFIKKSFIFDNKIICEQGHSVREIEISILGNYPFYETSEPGEIVPNHEFYSYEAKYLDENGAKLELPAKLSNEEKARIKELAKKAFQAVDGNGFARIDFFLVNKSNLLLINEINTLPGFTPISMFPKLWEISGKENITLIREIMKLGKERFENARKKTYSRVVT